MRGENKISMFDDKQTSPTMNELSKWQLVLYIVNLMALFGLIIVLMLLPYLDKIRGMI